MSSVPARKNVITSSAARAVAPPLPSLPRTSSRFFSISVRGSPSTRTLSVSSATLAGVKSFWINSFTTTRPAIRFTIA